MSEVCTICGGEFDPATEGGVQGFIGILPASFCVTCRVGVLDFADQVAPPFECPECGYMEEEGGENRWPPDADTDIAALIAGNVCIYDPRSEHYLAPFDYEDPAVPRVDCACDNCFYGRDRLAMTILRLAGND